MQHKLLLQVALAAQTLSSSVATALEFVNQLGYGDFTNVDGTVSFLRTIDQLFDILNSRIPGATGFKAPTTRENFHEKMEYLMDTRRYLLSLQTASGTPIVKSVNSTGFIGFVFCIESFLNIVRDLLWHPCHPFSYVLGYKFSQDHLELFFNAIRGSLGWNNNPTAHQLAFIFRRFLVHVGVEPDSSGNCVNFASSADDDFQIIDHLCEPDFYSDSDFVQNVIAYISGFVVKKVLKHETCPACRLALIDSPTNGNRSFEHRHFLRLKNNGGLLLPSNDVIVTLNKSESLYRRLPDFCSKKADRIFVKLFDYLSADVFSSVHFFESGHRSKLIRSLLIAFCDLRSFHIVRRMNFSHVTSRHRLNRTVLFRSE